LIFLKYAVHVFSRAAKELEGKIDYQDKVVLPVVTTKTSWRLANLQLKELRAHLPSFRSRCKTKASSFDLKINLNSKKSYLELEARRRIQKMTNETVEKAKADVKKGMAEVGKAAANLKDDVKADMERLKANFGHNADMEKKAGAKADTEEARDMVHFQQDLYDENRVNAKADIKDARDMVESIFGVNAGIVWEAFHQNGPMTIDDLVKATALNPEEIYGALGWLGRENKISLVIRGMVRFFSLRS
jgi:hypothetical protein